MDNLKKFTNEIKKFYALVELHENQIQDWIKEAKKPLHSIINQSLILRAVVPEDSVRNTAFQHFKGFRESLIEVIAASLEEELIYLRNIRDKIASANEKIYQEQRSIENLYADLRLSNSLKVSELNPCCPLFEHIIVWCHDIWCYYHSFYLQISQAISNLNFKTEESITNLSESFKEDLELKKHINKIRSFNFSNFEFII